MEPNSAGFMERRQEIGPIMFPMEVDKGRYHRFHSATQSRQKESNPLAKHLGMTCIIDGDIFYLPNGHRRLTKVPLTQNEAIKLDARYDSIDVIREPRWWTMEYAHLAFLEVESMQTGAFRWALYTLEYHYRRNNKTFSMRTIDIICWHRHP